AAAVAAGALTPAEGLRVTATRSRLMAPLCGQGTMALLELDAAATHELIAGHPHVTLAIYNSPRQTVISGPVDDIEELIAQLRAQNRFASRVNIEVAPHNPAMDALQPQMRSELADLTPRTPAIPIISTTYDNPDTGPVFDAAHWATNMRNPVHFQQAITTAGTNHHTFIEISPHPLLTQAILDTLHTAQHGTTYTSVPTLHRDTDDTITFRTNLYTTHHTHHWTNTTSAARQVSDIEHHNGSPSTTAAPSERLDGEDDGWCYAMTWPAKPLASAKSDTDAAGGRWLAVGHAELATELRWLAGPQSRVDVADASLLDEETSLIHALNGIDRVLYTPSDLGTLFDLETAYRLFHEVRMLAAAMVAADMPAKLFIVTRNAQPVAEGDRANP
ncbi:acyltransferase domain-containing protein, partial [Mycobacterium interjectum]|uniref:acyltransferase domain-containing protein n=1 Tax=Mycobacterium interjectum TaxID=33895 RepID=UPI0021F33662